MDFLAKLDEHVARFVHAKTLSVKINFQSISSITDAITAGHCSFEQLVRPIQQSTAPMPGSVFLLMLSWTCRSASLARICLLRPMQKRARAANLLGEVKLSGHIVPKSAQFNIICHSKIYFQVIQVMPGPYSNRQHTKAHGSLSFFQIG